MSRLRIQMAEWGLDKRFTKCVGFVGKSEVINVPLQEAIATYIKNALTKNTKIH